MSIAFLELVPIVVAAHLWGHAWSRLRVQFLCDNMAIVNVLNSGTSKSHDIMHLLRLLALETCRHNFVFLAAHTPGRDNSAADIRHYRIGNSSFGLCMQDRMESKVSYC
jgi:hypothetical protein